MASRRTRASATACVVAAACLPALLVGCTSDEDQQVSSACLGNEASYAAALETAPQQVRLPDGTPISECLTPEQEAGQLAAIGQRMIAVATDLNVAAQRDPTGPQAVRLGYLVGAIERGAEGIHADLVRRVNTAARYSPDGLLPAEFERTFGEGYAAGLESG